jgi:hypothetical protein
MTIRPGKRQIAGRDFQGANEVRYIRRRAAEDDGRWVTEGPLALFSTETGDSGCSNRKITWLHRRRGMAFRDAFVYTDKATSRIVPIFGYPVRRIAEWS